MTGIFIPSHYKELLVTEDDLSIASICWGFSLGFGFLTTWETFKQTRLARHPLISVYVWLIWGEVIVCLLFSIICWLHLRGHIPGSFFFYMSILTLWALQVQFLLQIIINRINVILPDRRMGNKIKWGTAALITAINISVYCIWVPARLQISETFYHVNEIWDRIEKVIYLIVDAILNWYFIRQVKRRLVQQGSKKYDRLVKFNVRIILLSLSMDCLIIGTMSLKNGFVYMQFHPLAYIVKLNIELSMASLIRKIAREKNDMAPSSRTYELSSGPGRSNPGRSIGLDSVIRRASHINSKGEPTPMHTGPGVMVHTQVIVESQSKEETESQISVDGGTSTTNGGKTMGMGIGEERRPGSGTGSDDEAPLSDSWGRVQYHAQVTSAV